MNGQRPMLDDIVLDTNVLVHSQNPNEQRYDHCCALLDCLLNCSTKIAVDEGFSLKHENNQSHIGYEYLDNLSFGSLAFSTISILATSKRISFLPKRAPQREHRIIIQSVRNTFDRVFLGVAYNSQEKILVSHDFIDFHTKKRDFFRNEIGVDIIEAHASLNHL